MRTQSYHKPIITVQLPILLERNAEHRHNQARPTYRSQRESNHLAVINYRRCLFLLKVCPFFVLESDNYDFNSQRLSGEALASTNLAPLTNLPSANRRLKNGREKESITI